MVALYDDIGRTYADQRQSDPRIGAAIEGALLGCDSILNVGAGTGSYEPRSKFVVAVEPSRTMIAQRAAGSAPVVQAYAEGLPFDTNSFDAVLGILTVHHWTELAKGFAECARVARSRVVFLTNDFDVCAKFWLFDYFPELIRINGRIFPTMAHFQDAFGPVETIAVPIPQDCRDGCNWSRTSRQASGNDATPNFKISMHLTSATGSSRQARSLANNVRKCLKVGLAA